MINVWGNVFVNLSSIDDLHECIAYCKKLLTFNEIIGFPIHETKIQSEIYNFYKVFESLSNLVIILPTEQNAEIDHTVCLIDDLIFDTK